MSQFAKTNQEHKNWQSIKLTEVNWPAKSINGGAALTIDFKINPA